MSGSGTDNFPSGDWPKVCSSEPGHKALTPEVTLGMARLRISLSLAALLPSLALPFAVRTRLLPQGACATFTCTGCRRAVLPGRGEGHHCDSVCIPWSHVRPSNLLPVRGLRHTPAHKPAGWAHGNATAAARCQGCVAAPRCGHSQLAMTNAVASGSEHAGTTHWPGPGGTARPLVPLRGMVSPV